MKKFFEKHDLFKILGIIILLVVILSWIIPTGSYSTEFVSGDRTPIGLTDIGVYLLLGVYYFAVIITYLLVLGGFYGVISKTKAYASFVEKVSKFLKGKEIPFVLITSFVIAALAGISNELYQIIVFIPLLITIMRKLKMDKMTAFCTTFGSIFIGLVGASFSPLVGEYSNYYLNITYKTELLTKIILFIVTYGLFNFFNIKHLLNVKKAKKLENEIEEKFEIEKVIATKSKVNFIPMLIVLAIVFVLQVIAFIGWSDAFEVTCFTKFHTWFTGISVGDYPIVSNILGTLNAEFGKWDLYLLQIVLIAASVIIALVNKTKIDEYFEQFFAGAKKMCRTTVLVVLAYAICVLTVIFAFVPTVVDWICSLAKNFNVYLTSLSVFISSIFNVELRYTVSSIGTYFAGEFGSEANSPIIGLILQSIYGFTQFFAPTSAILLIGLSYLNISYKNYLKYIWKFLLGLLVIILVVISLVTFVF